MEEKKPLESRLTHTSKEPEAQVWAQIGTKSYDPTAKQPTPIKQKTTPENGVPGEGSSSDTGTATNQEAEFFIDTGAKDTADKDTEDKDTEDKDTEDKDTEETAENEGEEDNPKIDAAKKSRRNMLGDGFETTAEAENTAESTDTGEKSTTPKSRSYSRSRSRSRSRERRRSPSRKSRSWDYSTNSNNPDDIKSRVFVGHLNTDKCTKEEVEKLFEPHGKITGVTLQNGYGFVQFEDEKCVKEAIKSLHATMFHEMKLVVDRPVALRKVEVAKSRDHHRERRDLMDELTYYRRRDQERMDSYYDRLSRDKYYPTRPPMPPPMPSQTSYYGDYMDRGDRYGGGGSGEGLYRGYGGESRLRDDHYRDREDRYRDDRYREDPYDYQHSQRGSYGDQYGKTLPRRMY